MLRDILLMLRVGLGKVRHIVVTTEEKEVVIACGVRNRHQSADARHGDRPWRQPRMNTGIIWRLERWCRSDPELLGRILVGHIRAECHAGSHAVQKDTSNLPLIVVRLAWGRVRDFALDNRRKCNALE